MGPLGRRGTPAVWLVCAVAVPAFALAQPTRTTPVDTELQTAARVTRAAVIEPGQPDAPIAALFNRFTDDHVFAGFATVATGDCGERSVPGAGLVIPATNADPICAILRATLRSGGGAAEIRFPIAAANGSLTADRSLHFAGVVAGGVSRRFASLDAFLNYLANRQNMLMYWDRASQVVLVETRELQYVKTRAVPAIHHRGEVLRVFRGDWRVGEPIIFVTSTEGRPDLFEAADVVLADPPRLEIAFMNEHDIGPIYLDTGWAWSYSDALWSAQIIEDLVAALRGCTTAADCAPQPPP